jgi:hypothetical protein
MESLPHPVSSAPPEYAIRVAEFGNADPLAWNQAALQDPQARVQQSYEGALIRQRTEGIRPLFISA